MSKQAHKKISIFPRIKTNLSPDPNAAIVTTSSPLTKDYGKPRMGTGLTVSGYLAEAPVVGAALRRAVRVDRHGQRSPHSSPARPPCRVRVPGRLRDSKWGLADSSGGNGEWSRGEESRTRWNGIYGQWLPPLRGWTGYYRLQQHKESARPGFFSSMDDQTGSSRVVWGFEWVYGRWDRDALLGF